MFVVGPPKGMGRLGAAMQCDVIRQPQCGPIYQSSAVLVAHKYSKNADRMTLQDLESVTLFAGCRMVFPFREVSCKTYTNPVNGN